MKLSSVVLARSIAFIDLSSLNVGGKVYFPDILKALVEQYEFKKFPTLPTEFNFEEGVQFHLGRWEGITIERLVIYTGIIYVETQADTDTSKAILIQLLEWLKEKHELTYSESSIKRWAYISQIVFGTDFPLLVEVSEPLRKMGEMATDAMSQIFGHEFKYQPIELKIGHDPMTRKAGIASLTITHRVGSRFDENLYFSESPLPTSIHWLILQDFEANIIGNRK